MGDYSQLPKADIILVTHSHYDHFKAETVEMLTKENTDLIISEDCSKDAQNRINDFLKK